MPDTDLVIGTNQTLRLRFRDKTVNASGQVTRTLVDLTGKSAKVHWSIAGGAQVTKTLVNENQTTNKGEATYQLQDADLTAGEMRIMGEVIEGTDNHFSLEAKVVEVKSMATLLGVT